MFFKQIIAGNANLMKPEHKAAIKSALERIMAIG